jgi:hypothetical protein
MDTGDIRQLAGLLEGEGSFLFHGSPRIALSMTDEDVVRWAHAVFRNTAEVGSYKYKRNRKRYWRTVVSSRLAAGWMMILYPFMGERRKQKIRQVLREWKIRKAGHELDVVYDRRLAKVA